MRSLKCYAEPPRQALGQKGGRRSICQRIELPSPFLTDLDPDTAVAVPLNIAARVSCLGISFTGTQGAAGNVVLISAKDHAEDTIKPGPEAGGANLDRIIEVPHIAVGGKHRPPEIPGDSVDHERPTSRSGAHAFANLHVTCKRCNEIKGPLSTAAEFAQLLAVLLSWPADARRSVLARLRAGARFCRA